MKKSKSETGSKIILRLVQFISANKEVKFPFLEADALSQNVQGIELLPRFDGNYKVVESPEIHCTYDELMQLGEDPRFIFIKVENELGIMVKPPLTKRFIGIAVAKKEV